MREVELYTDGSCLGNPGPGGWASILVCEGSTRMLSDGCIDTTNNRMEVTAVIAGLSTLRYKCNVIVTTDSKYVVDAFNKNWIYGWEKSGFRGRLNSDLWIQLLALTRLHNVEFKWVRGHNGHAYNEECDAEAQRQAQKYSRDYRM